ncbi:hypothetical protein J7I80_08390 [Bacillus sp. ISL-41]|uniref:DUF7010 family protein n=1 Tax=Bacillus sp. ISL-41 TaxID=2819127 RepID=UPI001BE9A9FF|nr:hypothetical protein [Bacillus sp. ISL-41]MBT2642241.1 hypothetical protein [Bacillus sp. ISL-41]
MKQNVSHLNFEELRMEISAEAGKGYPMFIAGIIFWLMMGVGGLFVPQQIMVWFYLFGIGLVLPLGILVSKVVHVNFLATHNPLSTIGGLVGGIQIFFAPIIILIAYQQPNWIPFVVGVLTGAHFLPYAAIYQSKGYIFQTVATVLAASVICFGWMDQAYLLIPFSLIIVYSITLFWLIKEAKVVKEKWTAAEKENSISM